MTEKESNLPASVAAMKGLANSVAAVGSGTGGEQYLKMTKFGEFVFGAEDLEVEEGAQWAVNPTQFTHGWICWGTKEHGTDGEMLGEVMVSASGPIPEEANLPEAKGKWTKQVGVQLLCLSGDDQDVQCVFKANSLGGKKAYTALVSAVVGEVNGGSEFICPVIELVSTHYVHKKYGKIFTPEFKILDWISMSGLAEAGADDDEEDEPEPKRTRKTKGDKKAKAKKTKAKPEVEEEEDEEEEEEAPRRRRKRGA